MTPDTPAADAIALLHLCDSLFPTGSFAHSDGLETATSEGLVATVSDLRGWMEAVLDETLERFEGPAVLLSWRLCADEDWPALRELDAELHALRPCASGRAASRAIGGRLLKTWQQIRPTGLIDRLAAEQGHFRFTLPVAFGVACGASGIASRATLEGFFYTRLASAVSAAMRLMPLGQGDAHGLLAEMLARVPARLDRMVERADRPMTFAPALDIAAMRHQYVHSRLFRS